ncbi:MAG: hypothetical protein DME04_09955 [Candidatus Rokuibacteriota bacterium]|nr:MAG: hypothetical protein DME04_09955 [Candidatus Rokubacteria bacterium]
MTPRGTFRLGLVVLVAALAVYPAVGTGYGVRAVLQIFMWIALAASWNLISGLTGYVSFGHVAFFGAGAYTGAILITRAGWSWPTAALAGVAFLFLQRTRLGKAIRATSQSREVAMVCGVDVQRIHRITFGIAAALAGAGGALVSVIVAIQPEMGQIWTFKSFLVIVLGGAGNYPGALLGGVLLGLVEQLASLFLTTQLSEAVAYILLVLILLVRPTGLLGGRQT